MGSLSDIKRRLESVKQTRRITCAMSTVSVAKMRKAADTREKSRAYTELVERIMSAAAYGEDVDALPIFARKNACAASKKYLLVLSTDTGLCGGFDHDILRFADGYIGTDTVILPIGRAASEYYRGRENSDMRFSDMYSATALTAKRIADTISELYNTDGVEVCIVYSESNKPTVKTVLPVQKPTQADGEENIAFEPSREEILKSLVPLYLTAVVQGAIQSHMLSEHSARHAAMTSATDSADKLISSLSVEYNRARQASVTGQIVEIIGAKAALTDSGGGV